MVAKSYQSLEICGDPYTVNSRKYVQVRTKNGSLKQVRWYSDYEYAKMYGEPTPKKTEIQKTQKEIFGFDNGYITIFKGSAYEDREYFKQSVARYCKMWGWYVVSSDEVMTDLPNDVEAVKLKWELVGNEDGSLKSEMDIKKAVEPLMYNLSSSKWAGEEGDKIEAMLTVDKSFTLEGGYYGDSQFHKFYDEDGNAYSWTTTARKLTVGQTYHIKGTIKKLDTYKNEKVTVLTRCRIVD